MKKTGKHSSYIARLQAFASGTALVCVLGFSTLPTTVVAQSFTELTGQQSPSGDSRMLLSADELVFDRDNHTVTAQGNVQIEYDGNRIVARQVTYNQDTKRVVASGNVELVDPKGMKVYADQIDLTDDLGEGFINSLRAETADNTRFAAESAERSDGQMTVFNNGIYTACEPCYYKPDKDIFWQVKARKIIWNGKTKTMRFEDSKFEMFGIPIAWFPVFEMADPTVKRKSGFLAPGFAFKSRLGFGVTNSYFWNLAPNYDFTLSATGYTKQGLLAQGEWRHRLENGTYDIRFNHIYQADPGSFNNWATDSRQTNRYSISSRGDFNINSRWTYGWDIMAQSDRNFSRTYGINGYNDYVQRSQAYLTGLNDRNYFDMRFYHFEVQEDLLKSNENERNSKQPWVLPRIDYTFIPDEAIFGGELKFTANLQTIYRDKADYAFNNWHDKKWPTGRIAGLSGTSARFSSEVEWKRTFISDFGLVVTPIFALRGDAFTINPNGRYGLRGNEELIHPDYRLDSITIRENAFRGMATAGLEVRYPILFTSAHSTHIIEPTAQIFVRNNERYTGKLTNEDAQSFVFDATTLFQRDKFSGLDRVEGGTRANVGIRYSGSFDSSDWSVYGLAGQSYHVSGKNSFASADLVNAGADSGLDKSRSDYVGMIGVDNGNGFSFAGRGRFDERNFRIRRGELNARKQWNRVTLASQYAYIERQPSYGYADNRQEVSVNGSYRFTDAWTINANSSYDLISDTVVEAGTSLGYQNECFGMTFGYLQTRTPGDNDPAHTWNFMLSFRTIGDFGK